MLCSIKHQKDYRFANNLQCFLFRFSLGNIEMFNKYAQIKKIFKEEINSRNILSSMDLKSKGEQ